MSTVEKLQSAVEHLAMAMRLLDQVGADMTAAHVDGALACLKFEVDVQTWSDVLYLDFGILDRPNDPTYSTFTGNHAALISAR